MNEDLKIKNSELQKYDGILSIKEEIESQNNKLSELNRKANNLNDRYKVAKSTYKELEKEIKLYQNNLEYIELGIYEPIFDYETSEEYKEKLSAIINEQKIFIKQGKACV